MYANAFFFLSDILPEYSPPSYSLQAEEPFQSQAVVGELPNEIAQVPGLPPILQGHGFNPDVQQFYDVSQVPHEDYKNLRRDTVVDISSKQGCFCDVFKNTICLLIFSLILWILVVLFIALPVSGAIDPTMIPMLIVPSIFVSILYSRAFLCAAGCCPGGRHTQSCLLASRGGYLMADNNLHKFTHGEDISEEEFIGIVSTAVIAKPRAYFSYSCYHTVSTGPENNRSTRRVYTHRGERGVEIISFVDAGLSGKDFLDLLRDCSYRPTINFTYEQHISPSQQAMLVQIKEEIAREISHLDTNYIITFECTNGETQLPKPETVLLEQTNYQPGCLQICLDNRFFTPFFLWVSMYLTCYYCYFCCWRASHKSYTYTFTRYVNFSNRIFHSTVLEATPTQVMQAPAIQFQPVSPQLMQMQDISSQQRVQFPASQPQYADEAQMYGSGYSLSVAGHVDSYYPSPTFVQTDSDFPTVRNPNI